MSADLYKQNLKDNGFEGTVIGKAICYNPDRTKLVRSSRTTGGNVVLSPAEAGTYTDLQYRVYQEQIQDIETITIEELLKDIDVVHFAKWDCEGAEIDALRKLSDEAAAKFRTMAGEYHLWGDGKKLLQASPLDIMAFWRAVKKKFPHLMWSWTPTASIEDKYGKFQAWPKRR